MVMAADRTASIDGVLIVATTATQFDKPPLSDHVCPIGKLLYVLLISQFDIGQGGSSMELQ